ncbi:MAG: enoyl-CoA hydratase-related protein, partial [Chloroflexi bacterium]|nr:enoyl-CoA hydratase-related protein [Chloroflexota bacterium]
METLQIERAAGVVTVTLNRPEKKNAINGPMWDELLATFLDIANRPDDRVVVVTGAGGAFCSGADLSGGGTQPGGGLDHMRHVGRVCAALHALPQPAIAKVTGVAAGAGCNLALGCDLIVASDDARFSEIFARRGLSIDFGGSWLLPRLVGLHKAKELALFADIISAKEALDIGIVNRVVPATEIDAFVADWATRLAAGP